MRQDNWFRCLLVCVLLLALVAGTRRNSAGAQETIDYETGEILVKLAQTSDLPSVAGDHGLNPNPLDQFGTRAIYRLSITDGVAPPDKAAALSGDDRVLFAEPNYRQQAPEGQQRISWARGGSAGVYAAQWGGDFLGLPAAHAVTQGDGITVAVLDSGVESSHAALKSRLIAGYDFVDMDDDPSEAGAPGVDITYGHGTHVAGLVALAAPVARIMPVRVLDRNGAGNIWVLAEALAYAVDPDGDASTHDGADVINLSLSTTRKTDLIEEVIADVICEDGDDDLYAATASRAADDDDDCLASPGRGAVVVAAAGNRGSTSPEYPAAESSPGLISVAANNAVGALAPFSNFGAWVTVAAPGASIVSSVPPNSYGVWSGTSMAAPLVAGQAALLRAAYPAHSPAAIADRIRATAVPGTAGQPPQVDAAAGLGLPRTLRPLQSGGAGGKLLFLPRVRK